MRYLTAAVAITVLASVVTTIGCGESETLQRSNVISNYDMCGFTDAPGLSCTSSG